MNFIGVFLDRTSRSPWKIRQVADPQMPFRIHVTLPDELDQLLQTHRDYPFEIVKDLKGWIDLDEQGMNI